MQRYTVYYIWKLLYMFLVVPPPIIRSAYNCIYSIWYTTYVYTTKPAARTYTRQQHKQKVQPHAQIKFVTKTTRRRVALQQEQPLKMVEDIDRNM
jgi:hypothetical protein